jgi:hypothetical protein
MRRRRWTRGLVFGIEQGAQGKLNLDRRGDVPRRSSNTSVTYGITFTTALTPVKVGTIRRRCNVWL